MICSLSLSLGSLTSRMHHLLRTSLQWNAKTIAMLITSVASNAAGLPVAIASFQYGFVHEAAVALATILFSTLYHLGDTLDNDVIGLSPGSWHRLDNVVAIYGFQLIILALSGLHAAGSSGNEQRRTTAELVRTVLFAITMWMQEMGPWNVWCAVGPIVCALLAALLPHVAPGGLAQLRRQRLRSVLSSVDFVAGCAATAAAAVCFAVALEEQRDPLRLLHGCWHVFASAGFFFFLRAVATKDELNVDRVRVVSANESSRASETAKEKVG